MKLHTSKENAPNLENVLKLEDQKMYGYYKQK